MIASSKKIYTETGEEPRRTCLSIPVMLVISSRARSVVACVRDMAIAATA